MPDLVRPMPPFDPARSGIEPLSTREWLVTNGLGGYASGTVRGLATRRYHGLLIAALPAPLGRTMMLKRLSEQLGLEDGTATSIGVEEIASSPLDTTGTGHLDDFRLEDGLPVWRFAVRGFVLEKRLVLPHLQNTVYVTYRLLSGPGRLRLILRPAVHFRGHDAPVDVPHPAPYRLTAWEDRYELAAAHDFPPLRMTLHGPGAAFTLDAARTTEIHYEVEASRGYESTGDLWSPGYFRVELTAEAPVTLIASTEAWETLGALRPDEALRAERGRRARLIASAHPEARSGIAAELVLAADQFLITPAGRVEDAARAHAAGDEVRTVIAGYHWFTDWGRDTMISLEGLTLTTGRHVEAGYILRTFAHYVRDGLIPNLFPEGETRGALPHRRRDALVLPRPRPLPRRHRRPRHAASCCCRRCSTSSSITCAARASASASIRRDGLLRQGAGGLSAHLDGRQGRRLGGDAAPRQGRRDQRALVQRAAPARGLGARGARRGRRGAPLAEHADRASDVLQRALLVRATAAISTTSSTASTGDDPACRPNQIFAISLPHPVLDRGALGAGRRGGPRASCSRRSACARWRPAIPTTRRSTTATCARATPPITRAPSGPG